MLFISLFVSQCFLGTDPELCLYFSINIQNLPVLSLKMGGI